MADAVLGRAARLWALLDEMAENQPRAYRRLLREQRAQAERFCARPEPRLCVRTLPAAGKRHPGLGPARGAACAPLFVNVCGWRRVPGPAELRASIPVIAGPLQEAAGGGGACPAPGGGPGRGGGRGPSVPKKPQTGTRPSPAEDAYPVAAGAEHGPLLCARRSQTPFLCFQVKCYREPQNGLSWTGPQSPPSATPGHRQGCPQPHPAWP